MPAPYASRTPGRRVGILLALMVIACVITISTILSCPAYHLSPPVTIGAIALTCKDRRHQSCN